jgi:hypothetical protein
MGAAVHHLQVVDLEVSFICNEPGVLATTLEIQVSAVAGV